MALVQHVDDPYQAVAASAAGAPDPACAEAAAGEDLTGRLSRKLAELEGRGFRVQWIAASRDELVQLFVEGGEQAILMDPDPTRDVAWFGSYEIRPSEAPGVWVYIEGEFDGISRHHV